MNIQDICLMVINILADSLAFNSAKQSAGMTTKLERFFFEFSTSDDSEFHFADEMPFSQMADKISQDYMVFKS